MLSWVNMLWSCELDNTLPELPTCPEVLMISNHDISRPFTSSTCGSRFSFFAAVKVSSKTKFQFCFLRRNERIFSAAEIFVMPSASCWSELHHRSSVRCSWRCWQRPNTSKAVCFSFADTFGTSWVFKESYSAFASITKTPGVCFVVFHGLCRSRSAPKSSCHRARTRNSSASHSARAWASAARLERQTRRSLWALQLTRLTGPRLPLSMSLWTKPIT